MNMIGWQDIIYKAKKFLKRSKKAKIKTWYLFVVLILSILGAVWGLRHNNLTMISLRSDVLAADSSGKGLEQSLNKLSDYVFHHMNTSVYNLELVGSYNRAVARVVANSQTEKNANTNIYHEAQVACESGGGAVTAIAQCAQNYVLTHMSSDKAVENIKFPDVTPYIYNFSAPVWSPDLAGWSLLVAIISAAWLVERAVTELVAILIVRRRHL